jgi:hypothetical protein
VIGRRGFRNAEPPRASWHPGRPALAFEDRRADPGLQRPADSARPVNARAPPDRRPVPVRSARQEAAVPFQKRSWASGAARQPSQTELHPTSITERSQL